MILVSAGGGRIFLHLDFKGTAIVQLKPRVEWELCGARGFKEFRLVEPENPSKKAAMKTRPLVTILYYIRLYDAMLQLYQTISYHIIHKYDFLVLSPDCVEHRCLDPVS